MRQGVPPWTRRRGVWVRSLTEGGLAKLVPRQLPSSGQKYIWTKAEDSGQVRSAEIHKNADTWLITRFSDHFEFKQFTSWQWTTRSLFFNFRDENKNFFFSLVLQKWGWFSQELSRLRIHVGLYTTMQQGGSVIELTLPVLRLLGFEQILPRKHFSSLESEGEPPKYSWLKFDGMTRSRRMLYYKWTGWIEWISGWVS